MTETLKGNALLQNGALSKGTAYTAEERKALGLTGLLPPDAGLDRHAGRSDDGDLSQLLHAASEEHLP